MIALPVDAIRQTIRDGDWDAAHAVLAEHEAALRSAFEGGSAAETACRASWLELLAAQRAMIDELRGARDEASRALDRMGRDRRGMAAYLEDAG